ncbi:MAG: transcription antitermination factor NusB [Clostridium sp.]|nr:transcription antitermination factor NusB [Clostridium sp.]MCI7442710.1 transcription antitermination factor NusB [Clostridium sp.]
MNRKKSREKAMELLFSITLSKDSVEEAMEVFVDNYEGNIKELDLDYIKALLEGVEANKNEIDSIIERNLQNWKLDRISKINLTILRVGVYEIVFDENIPKKVALNEAIELGKIYSDEKSVSFINGVLDKVLKEA